MGSLPPSQPQPGILLVHPRLHNPTQEDAATFLRWTKLHWRDLLNLPAADLDGGKPIRALRFGAAEGNRKYGHIEGTESAYIYLILATSISAFRTQEYDDMTRRLDVENTRDLLGGEEAVGCNEGSMVWDVVDAKFVVYSQIAEEKEGAEGLDAYKSKTGKEKICLVAISTMAEPYILRDEVIQLWERNAPKQFRVYSSVYRDAGPDAQPNQHPKIEKELVGGGEWLMLLLVVDEEGSMLKVEHAEMMMEGWVKEKEKEGNGGMKFGVWEGELDMC